MFTQGPFLALRLAGLVLISVILMTVDHRLRYLEPVRAVVSTAVLPLQYLVNLPHAVGSWLGTSFASREELLRENAELRRNQLKIAVKLQQLDALDRENQRLRTLLKSSGKVGERAVVAELLGVDLDPYKHQVVINKGSVNGAYVGQPILDAHGVMGQLIHVGPVSSSAILITDPSHALPVQINRNGLRAIATGTGSLNRLDVQYLPNNADVQVGDLLVTSGLGGRFPPGYPVAVVKSVRRNPGQGFLAISATPTADLDRSREVLLVWSGRRVTEAPPP